MVACHAHRPLPVCSLAQNAALKLGPATLVAPIDKLSVVLVALFGVVFLGERTSMTGWLGIALIAAGAVIIVIKR